MKCEALGLSCLIFSLATSAPAQALEQDRDQPLQINAATVNINEKTGVAVYHGHVVLIQGSMRLDADRLEVLTRGMHFETATATGHPVRMRALLDNRKDELKASAERIVLHTGTRTLDLSGNVLLRQGGDQFSAQEIHYALDEQRMTAAGSGDEDGRVYAILQPTRREKQGEKP